MLLHGAFAETPTLDPLVVGGQKDYVNPTNMITGEVTRPEMTAPLPGLIFETNVFGEINVITNQVTMIPQKSVRVIPEVRITANGAVGSHPRLGHSVEFSGNLNHSDSVVMHLPSTGLGSVTLQGHAIGIGLMDNTGRQAWLGQIKNCSGVIDEEQPNVVRWPDAFTGIRADVVFVYGQTFIEQLVVLRENPIIPPEIDKSSARLFVMSEFYQTPEPRKESRSVKLREDKDLEGKYGVMMMDDEVLDWGWMRMAEGRAFVWQKSSGSAVKPSVPTSKLWQKNGNRVFLLEFADYLSLKPALDELASIKSDNRHAFMAESLPEQVGVESKHQPLQLAILDSTDDGVVLDFKLVNSALINVNFGGDNKSGAAVVGSTGDNWNSYVHPYYSDVTVPNLIWNSGSTPSQVSLRVQNANGQWGFVTTDPMYYTYIYPSMGGNITLTVNNLPAGDYDLYFYGHGGAANQNSTFTLSVNQSTIGQQSTLNSPDWQQSSTWVTNLQYIGFPNVHINAGDVATVVVSPNASSYAVINGMQISAWNESPSAWAGADQSIILPNNASLIGTATNDSYPPNHSMALTWSKYSGFGTVSLNPQSGVGTSLPTTATFSSPGAYTMRFVADDSQLKDTNDVLVTVNPPNVRARDTAWVEDTVPRGGALVADYDVWNWVSSSPAPLSGFLSHQSLNTSGFHQHYFIFSTQTMTIAANDWLFCYIYLEADKMPGEIVLAWRANDSTLWDHRASWGPNLLTWLPAKTKIGDVPASGRWIRLAVPASTVNLVGRTLVGMAFTISNGRATWDLAGKSTASGFDDTDGDGMTDSDEVYIFHTDPNSASNADSDGDGLPDVWENYFFGNLSQKGTGDWDGDGISNAEALHLAIDPAGTLGLQVFTPMK